MKTKLLTPFNLYGIEMSNRIVMSSLTRSRVTNKELAPTALQATYYLQRASAGLIVTESVWVSEDAIGFINIPGIFTDTQIRGWKETTKAVHEKNGKIFIQLAHSGAVSHADFFEGRLPKGPSAINPQEKSFTPQGFKDTETPDELTIDDIKEIIKSYKSATENALVAGFDGIEIHAQLFTLIPQFLSTATNKRTDEYGGNIENRSRILFEILDEVIKVFPGKVGIKFTPSAFNQGLIRPDENTINDYQYILAKLNKLNLAYLHIVGPAIELKDTHLNIICDDYFGFFRENFQGVLIANLGFNKQTANEIINSGKADLVSFGTLFIANPDLIERFTNDWPLANADPTTYYTSGEIGYIDYPNYLSD